MSKATEPTKPLIPLSRVASLINNHFDLLPNDEVGYATPYVWWDRSKRNVGISLPMPDPVQYMGANNRGPLWFEHQIVEWYTEWQEVES